MAVVQASGRDHGHEQVAVCIRQCVAVAPDDPPGRIVTAFAFHPDATRAGGLRIDDTAGRAGLASNPLTVGHRESMSEALEHACLREAQESTMHCADGAGSLAANATTRILSAARTGCRRRRRAVGSATDNLCWTAQAPPTRHR